MKDEEIVNLFFERNENAISETEKKYGKYIAYIANNILGNESDSEECENDVLLASWNSIPPNRPENFKAFVGKIAREIAISRWRHNSAKKRCPTEFEVSLDEIAEVAADSDFSSEADSDEIGKAVSSFLRSVSEKERNVFIRRYFYGDAIKSICERMNVSESLVKITLKRTRDKLSQYLKKEGLIT